SYDVRFSTSPIDDSSFASATRASGTPNPAPSGAAERMDITGLTFNTLYFFAVKARDDFGNSGSLSNTASATTLGPPAFEISPSSLSADLFTGQTSRQVLNIRNSGMSNLQFAVAIRLNGSGSLAAPFSPPAVQAHPAPDPASPDSIPHPESSSTAPAGYTPVNSGT